MTEHIPREFIELLLNKVDLVDLINTRVPLRKKSGSNYFACCPFHQEKNPSFSVSQPKQFYYCFGCGARGNAIDFLMNYDRLNFPEAVEQLARQTGMEIPRSHQHQPSKKEESLPALFDLMAQAADYYRTQLKQAPRAIEYLKNRGITGETARQFGLGYAPNGWSNLLDHLGKTEADKKKLLDVGLVIKKAEGGYYDRFRDRIQFPIQDYRGRLIGFGGRIIDQGEPKYLNSPETVLFQKGHELYGLYQALKINRTLPRVVIVEGYMDVIALFQHGITYAVATLGTATTHYHLERLFRYTAEIIFCFDGDEAGRTAAWRALQVVFPLMHDNLQIRFLFLPEGEDPDTLVRKEGQAALEERLNAASSLSAFFFQTLAQQADLNTLEGRARFASSAMTYIKQLSSDLFQSMMLEALAKRARIELSELKQQLKGQSRKETPPQPVAATPMPTASLPAPLRLLLALLIQFPESIQHLPAESPGIPLPWQSIFAQLIEMITKNKEMNTGMVLEYWRGRPEENLIAELAHWEHMIPATGVKGEVLGALRQLAMLDFDAKINVLLAKAAQEELTEEEKQTLASLIGKKKVRQDESVP